MKQGQFASHLKRQAMKQDLEMKTQAAIQIQRIGRGRLGRRASQAERHMQMILNDKARRIQLAWRFSKGKRTLMARFSLRKTSMEEDRVHQEYMERQRIAEQKRLRKQEAATQIQKEMRRVLAVKVVSEKRYQIALESAVRRIQTSWRKAKGKYALHIRFLARQAHLARRKVERRRAERQRAIEAERQRLEEEAIWLETRMEASIDIQKVWRGKLGRMRQKRMIVASIKI